MCMYLEREAKSFLQALDLPRVTQCPPGPCSFHLRTHCLCSVNTTHRSKQGVTPWKLLDMSATCPLNTDELFNIPGYLSYYCCRNYPRRKTGSLPSLCPFTFPKDSYHQSWTFQLFCFFKKTVGRQSTCCLPGIQEMSIMPYGLFSTHPHGLSHKQRMLWQLGQVPLGWLLCLEMTRFLFFFFLNLHYIFIAHIQS